jgi:hypothetical protein
LLGTAAFSAVLLALTVLPGTALMATTTIPLAANVTLPSGDVAQGTDYYIGVNAQGQSHIGADALGVAVSPGLHTWEIDFDTTNASPASTCLWEVFWSLDASQPRLALPGNGGAGFNGGTWSNPKTGLVTGAKRIGPDPIQQSPYPTKFIIHVKQCTAPMLLTSVSLVLT